MSEYVCAVCGTKIKQYHNNFVDKNKYCSGECATKGIDLFDGKEQIVENLDDNDNGKPEMPVENQFLNDSPFLKELKGESEYAESNQTSEEKNESEQGS